MKLTKRDLLRLKHTLASHHSRDPHHLQRLTAAMSGGPWKCGWCRKTAKATAYHCQNCGGSWEDADPDFDPPARSQSQKKQSRSGARIGDNQTHPGARDRAPLVALDNVMAKVEAALGMAPRAKKGKLWGRGSTRLDKSPLLRPKAMLQ